MRGALATAAPARLDLLIIVEAAPSTNPDRDTPGTLYIDCLLRPGTLQDPADAIYTWALAVAAPLATFGERRPGSSGGTTTRPPTAWSPRRCRRGSKYSRWPTWPSAGNGPARFGLPPPVRPTGPARRSPAHPRNRAMTAHDFIAKWQASELKERSASQEHFIDLCKLLGEPTPAEADPPARPTASSGAPARRDPHPEARQPGLVGPAARLRAGEEHRASPDGPSRGVPGPPGDRPSGRQSPWSVRERDRRLAAPPSPARAP